MKTPILERRLAETGSRLLYLGLVIMLASCASAPVLVPSSEGSRAVAPVPAPVSVQPASPTLPEEASPSLPVVSSPVRPEGPIKNHAVSPALPEPGPIPEYRDLLRQRSFKDVADLARALDTAQKAAREGKIARSEYLGFLLGLFETATVFQQPSSFESEAVHEAIVRGMRNLADAVPGISASDRFIRALRQRTAEAEGKPPAFEAEVVLTCFAILSDTERRSALLSSASSDNSRYLGEFYSNTFRLPDGLVNDGVFDVVVYFQEYYKEILWRRAYLNFDRGFSSVRFVIGEAVFDRTRLTQRIHEKYLALSELPDDPVTYDYRKKITILERESKAKEKPEITRILDLVGKGSGTILTANSQTEFASFLTLDYLGFTQELVFCKRASEIGGASRSVEIHVPRAPENRRDFSSEVFSGISDGTYQYVVFNGHSGMGLSLEKSFASAPFSMNPAIIQLSNCDSGIQLPLILERFPRAHAIVTRQKAYSTDGAFIFRAVIENYLRFGPETTYRRIVTTLEGYDQTYRDNYLLPNNSGYQEAVKTFYTAISEGTIGGIGARFSESTEKRPYLEYVPELNAGTESGMAESAANLLKAVVGYQAYFRTYGRGEKTIGFPGTGGWFRDPEDRQFLLDPDAYEQYRSVPLRQDVSMSFNQGYAGTSPFLFQMAGLYEGMMEIGAGFQTDHEDWIGILSQKKRPPADCTSTVNEVRNQAGASLRTYSGSIRRIGISSADEADFIVRVRAFTESVGNTVYEAYRNAGQQVIPEADRRSMYGNFCRFYSFTEKDGSILIPYDDFIGLCEGDDSSDSYEGVVFKVVDYLAGKNVSVDVKRFGLASGEN
jgi:hypothetical protein